MEANLAKVIFLWAIYSDELYFVLIIEKEEMVTTFLLYEKISLLWYDNGYWRMIW